MRIIGYPPLESSEGTNKVGFSCGEHTGINIYYYNCDYNSIDNYK